MIIITKTSKAAARSVSLEQITAAAMAIARNARLGFIQNNNNRWRCHKCCTSATAKINSYTNSLGKRNTENCPSRCSHHFGYSFRQFITIGLIGIILFVNCPIFVVAAAKNSIRSIANNDGNDPYRIHSNWFEFQRQSLNQRSQSIQAQPQELGNIFSQLGIFIQSRQRNATELAGNIFFKYYNTEGDLLYESNFSKPQDLLVGQCHRNGRFAILMHGWRESCNTTWMKQLIKKLGTYRGGCLICMDYSQYAAESYVRLVRVFDPMAQVLTLQLHLLDYMGFDMNNGYLFGFSYGGQLATEAGRRFGYKRLKEIDTCDMAGPGFDHRSTQPDHRDAAQNVQCIHTSRDKGTRFYNCHQDWRLGNCGLTQVASNSPPLGSHGLCPYMYVNAFDHDFYAIDKPSDCVSKHMAKFWPQSFKMGYMENRKWQVSGELFAQTSRFHPFNIIGNSNSTERGPESSNSISKEVYQRDVSSSVPEVLHPNSNALQRLKERILKYIFQDHIFN